MIDLANLTKQKGETGEKSLVSPASVPVKKIKPDLPKTNVKYFYSQKPNIAFFMGNKRIKFDGNYYETADPVLIEYILQHYGNLIVEITEEQKIDGQTTKG